MFFIFITIKTFREKLSSFNVCEAALQATSAYIRHTPLWLLIGRIMFLTHRSRFLLDVSYFSRVKTIVRSSDWVELVCV